MSLQSQFKAPPQEIPSKKLHSLDVNLAKLREFNDAAFHKFAPVIPFEPLSSDVFLVGVMGSGITLVTQIANSLRSNSSMDFEEMWGKFVYCHCAVYKGLPLAAMLTLCLQSHTKSFWHGTGIFFLRVFWQLEELPNFFFVVFHWLPAGHQWSGALVSCSSSLWSRCWRAAKI